MSLDLGEYLGVSPKEASLHVGFLVMLKPDGIYDIADKEIRQSGPFKLISARPDSRIVTLQTLRHYDGKHVEFKVGLIRITLLPPVRDSLTTYDFDS